VSNASGTILLIAGTVIAKHYQHLFKLPGAEIFAVYLKREVKNENW
jgi:hypothetical protein